MIAVGLNAQVLRWAPSLARDRNLIEHSGIGQDYSASTGAARIEAGLESRSTKTLREAPSNSFNVQEHQYVWSALDANEVYDIEAIQNSFAGEQLTP